MLLKSSSPSDPPVTFTPTRVPAFASSAVVVAAFDAGLEATFSVVAVEARPPSPPAPLQTPPRTAPSPPP